MCPQQRTKRHDNISQCLDTLGTPGKSKCGFCIKFGREDVQNYIIPNTSCVIFKINYWVEKMESEFHLCLLNFLKDEIVPILHLYFHS